MFKSIPKFWPTALTHCEPFALHVQHEEDADALSYLEDLWVERDSAEPRVFTLELVRGMLRRTVCVLSSRYSTSRRTRTSATR